MAKKKVQPKDKQPKSEQELANEFVKQYQALCDKTGFQVVVTPAFKARDDGTWSVVLQTSIGRQPENDRVQV